jgi:hypothetical protein
MSDKIVITLEQMDNAARYLLELQTSALWDRMREGAKGRYRTQVAEVLSRCGFEHIVVTSETTADHMVKVKDVTWAVHDLTDMLHVVNCQECYNKIQNGVRPHVDPETTQQG